MVCVCIYVVSSFILALVQAMSLEKIKLDGKINRFPFVTSLVISWLLPGTVPGNFRADCVEISENYHLNNTTVLIVHRIVLFWEPDRCFQDGGQENRREVGTYLITISS